MKKVLCGVLLLTVLACFAPAALADVEFSRHHRSDTWLVDNKPDYTHAEFSGVYLGLSQKEGTKNEPQERKFVIKGGAYGYRRRGKLVEIDNASSGAEMTFDLNWYEEDKEYAVLNDAGEEINFIGKADTGLNGVTVSWTGTPEGSDKVPNYLSTAEQLKKAVPYVELTRSGNNITGFTVKMVKASAPEKPVTSDEIRRFRVRFNTAKGWVKAYDSGDDSSPYTGTTMEKTLDAPIPEKELNFVRVDVNNKSGANYRWRFFLPSEKLEFWTHHRSEASLVNDKSDYSKAVFAGVALGLETTADTSEPQERKLIIKGGAYSYRYRGKLVEIDNVSSGTEKSFGLKRLDEEYVVVNEDGEEIGTFLGKADTGLNGVTVRWTGNPEGNRILPKFTSTKEQLATAVPYVTLTRDSSKNVTGFTVRMVKASDPTKPLAVENARLQVRVGQNGKWKQRTWTDTGDEWKDYRGSDLSNTLATPIPDGEFTGLDVRVRVNSDTTHRWRFYPAAGADSSEEEKAVQETVDGLNGDAKETMSDSLSDPETKEAAQEVAKDLSSSLTADEIANLSPEEIKSAVENKAAESKAAESEERDRHVASDDVPAGIDLLKTDASVNADLKKANNALSVKPKIVTPKKLTSAAGLDLPSNVTQALVFNIFITPADKSLEEQTTAITDLFNKVSADLASAKGVSGNGVVIATVLPKMEPNENGFFPMKVNLRNVTPGRKLKFWPRADSIKTASVSGVSLAADPQEGDCYFLDQDGNKTETVSGNAAEMVMVPYLKKDGNYSAAFITVDATASDDVALKALAEAAKSGGESKKPDTDSPTSDKSSGGCDAGFGLAGMLALAANLLTLRKK